MKKAIKLILSTLILFNGLIQAQSTINTYTSSKTFQNLDNLQIYQGIRMIQNGSTVTALPSTTTNLNQQSTQLEVNNSLTYIKTKVDSLVNATKFKIITFTITTTSTNTAYAVNNAISSTLTPNGFSVNLGAGNWKIENATFTTPAVLSTASLNVAVFSNTVNSQTDHAAIDIYQGAVNQNYLGTMRFNTKWAMSTGISFEAQTLPTAASLGRMPIYCESVIYLVPYAVGVFTPALNQQYIFKLFLTRLN